MSEAAIDEVVAAFYAAFDNRGGRAPSTEALLALFAPEARITRVAGADVDTWSPEEFAAPRIAILTDGSLPEFHEWETSSTTLAHTQIAARWSTYEKESGGQRGGGRNLIQLRCDGGRWLISSLLWEDDVAG